MSFHNKATLTGDGVISFGLWDGRVFYAVLRTVSGQRVVEIVVRDDGLGDWVPVGLLADGVNKLDIPPWIEVGVSVTEASGLDARLCIYSGEGQ